MGSKHIIFARLLMKHPSLCNDDEELLNMLCATEGLRHILNVNSSLAEELMANPIIEGAVTHDTDGVLSSRLLLAKERLGMGSKHIIFARLLMKHPSLCNDDEELLNMLCATEGLGHILNVNSSLAEELMANPIIEGAVTHDTDG